MTFVLGLTGSIATGKSTVANFFKKQGIPVVDSDIIARQVVEPETVGLAKIIQEFGTSVLLNDGSLNRKKLGAIIFNDDTLREKLSKILSTELNQEISAEIKRIVEQNVPLVVVDVPLLYEAGYEEKMDEIMVVYVPFEEELKRLMARNSLTKEEAKKRIASQMSIEEKKAKADVVIDNSGSVLETEKQVKNWLESMKLK